MNNQIDPEILKQKFADLDCPAAVRLIEYFQTPKGSSHECISAHGSALSITLGHTGQDIHPILRAQHPDWPRPKKQTPLESLGKIFDGEISGASADFVKKFDEVCDELYAMLHAEIVPLSGDLSRNL